MGCQDLPFLKAYVKGILDNYILPFSALFSLPFWYHWPVYVIFFKKNHVLGILKFFLFIFSLATWKWLYTSILFHVLFSYVLPLFYDLGFLCGWFGFFWEDYFFDSQLFKVSKCNGLFFLFFGTICAFNVTFLHKLSAYLHMFFFKSSF